VKSLADQKPLFSSSEAVSGYLYSIRVVFFLGSGGFCLFFCGIGVATLRFGVIFRSLEKPLYSEKMP